MNDPPVVYLWPYLFSYHPNPPAEERAMNSLDLFISEAFQQLKMMLYLSLQ